MPFFMLALAIGMAWATASAATGGISGIPQAAALNPSQPADGQDTAVLANKVASSGDLTWNWSGQWGSVGSQAMYTVDLDALPAGESHHLGVYLTNVPAGFADLQLQFRMADVGAAGSCNASAIEGVSNAADHRVMAFDAADAQVTFSGMSGAASGLPGGSTYCVGVANYSGAGMDPAGTFIRKSSAGPAFNGSYPRFVVALSRMG
jgi:hypothetical protein